ncbi:hypothetical protein IKF15_03455 [Candidatus Saccharibacteria bacterium]|nr:hypothetical protein [Candidatus Saccharibacteria bacterium]
MNKDVIYIEPEHDITDILANIKGSTHKIVALVPPKKAGVLRSAVNFKLIAKTAAQTEKTVVLISADDALSKLAASVKMPIAKTLQSKPQLPADLDVAEFGDPHADDDVIEAEPDTPEKEQEPVESAEAALLAERAKEKKATASKPAQKDADRATREPDSAASKESEAQTSARSRSANDATKKPHAKIPDFKKNRKIIFAAIAGAVAFVIFLFWAFVIAPAARITVTVQTTSQNFSESVSFVSNAESADPEKGVFYIEQKTIKRTKDANFTATGEVDKGTKASGNIQVIRPKGTEIKEDGELSFSIPAGTTFTINGMSFTSTAGASATITESDLDKTDCKGIIVERDCKFTLKKDISSGNIPVTAKENGEKYNIAAASSGWTSSLNTSKSHKITSSAMTGGTTKMVKTVSAKDLEDAAGKLDLGSESDAKEELAGQFSKDYVLIGDSFTAEEPKVTSSPALNEEVGEGVTPKVVKELTYRAFAVKRSDLNVYITKQSESTLGDDTREIYSTGVAKNDSKNKAFFENVKKSGDTYTARLKSTVEIGPKVTEEMIKEKSLGKKVGEVQSLLKSINGVSEVKVDTSFFWVRSVPKDESRVKIKLERNNT